MAAIGTSIGRSTELHPQTFIPARSRQWEPGCPSGQGAGLEAVEARARESVGESPRGFESHPRRLRRRTVHRDCDRYLYLGFTLRRRTQIRISVPIVRVELGLHNFMQLPHKFIGSLPLRPCLDLSTHSYAFHFAEDIMGNANHLQ